VRAVRVISGRLRGLLIGRVEWFDPDDNLIEVEWMGWRDRWAIFGVHSSNWRWVRRFGIRDCGCTFNPITRRRVLTLLDCREHGFGELLNDDDDGDKQ